ncbi:MAG TPA: TIGR03088 family PEP-CTERM/XrtA system glycosyltransferase [Steroidobacteraceae bacterium]|nr:TIGR03088 family PEP-CTERM/XrtA system glycosyltransferase [Steroidobacteraceae bacterium]
MADLARAARLDAGRTPTGTMTSPPVTSAPASHAVPGAPPLVAHIIFRLDVGGLENGLVNLINNMPPERYRHGIVALAGHSEFRKRLTRDVPVYDLQKQPGKDPGAYLRLAQLLRSLRPAIVHTRNLGTVDCQWVARIAGCRLRVHGEHGWEVARSSADRVRQVWLRKLCRPVVQQYVAVSRDLAQWLTAAIGVSPAKIEQIYNGVDPTRFHPEGEVATLPWTDGGAGAPFVIGTVGRLEATKNQGLLIEAFARLLDSPAARQRQVRLAVIGDGPLRPEVEALVARHCLQEKVWLAGRRNDIPALMRGLDVFVLPSLNEGISNTVLEAMASALPVVAARVGGNVELIEDRVTGRLFPVGDAEQLAGALGSYLERPVELREHGLAGRARVMESFDLQSMVRSYAALYDRMLGRAHAR